MTTQREQILISVNYIKKLLPEKFNPKIAVISEKHFGLEKNFKILGGIEFKKIPPVFNITKKINTGRILFVRSSNKDVILLNGRPHFYDGFSMREIGHYIYVLKMLGITKILGIEEIGYFNPRFKCGELSVIYDHINLMGDNPLIGENDSELGLRFPDMSNAYDAELFSKLFKVFQDNKIKINEGVYLGTIGPETETEAEARFYREIGSDVTGYSLVPEDITAVHANIKYCSIGLLSRNLIADKMLEDTRDEKQKIKDQKESLKKSLTILNKIIKDIIDKL